MSGHNKWSTIKHRKGAQDAKRGKIFTKIIKEITVAARMGGGDASANSRLRRALDEARLNNMPADNVTRAIKKGTGELEGVHYEELVYEGVGPSGMLVLCEVMTDNRNERLDSSAGSMPGILWLVLVIGGLITLGYPAFFGSSNLLAQVLMTAALAELVALAMVLGVAFDYPFTGEVHISPYPFDQALQQMSPIWPPP